MKRQSLCLITALLAASGPARSHDTWFENRSGPQARPAEQVVALGTGNQFPKQETAIGVEYLTTSGCEVGGAVQAFKPLRYDPPSSPVALLLRPATGASSCWLQLQAFDVTVPADKVPVYLKEINASPEIRATWAAMEARGLPWREQYVKHARIELGAEPAAAATRLPLKPLGMDLRLERTAGALVAGGSVTAVVLRDGQPLPNQALELRSEDSPLGIWRRSDEQGRVTLPLPLPGNWLLRGVDLRVAADNPDLWHSRFVTLAFKVQPKPANTP